MAFVIQETISERLEPVISHLWKEEQVERSIKVKILSSWSWIYNYDAILVLTNRRAFVVNLVNKELEEIPLGYQMTLYYLEDKIIIQSGSTQGSTRFQLMFESTLHAEIWFRAFQVFFKSFNVQVETMVD